MKIGDKVKVVDRYHMYGAYQEMARIMDLKKYHYMSNDLWEGDIVTILNIQPHMRINEDLVIGCYCERSDEDFILDIQGVEAIEYKEGKQ